MMKSLFLCLALSLPTASWGHGVPNDSILKSEQTQLRKDVLNEATALLGLFEDKSQVLKAFESKERSAWTNLPVGIVPRTGVSIGAMNEAQRIQLHRLLSSVLSAQGYLKTTGVMHLDNILERYFNIPRLKWSHKEYYFTFWGQPDTQSPWGFKLEGHHLSLNFTFHDLQVHAQPMFLGSDPAEIRESEYAGWRVFGEEEDLGFRLLASLDSKQQQQAILDREVPQDILTNPDASQRLTEYWGLAAKAMNAHQRYHLMAIIDEYLNNLEAPLAGEIRSQLDEKAIDAIYFAWIGAKTPGDRYYYLIHSPRFIIEFDNHDNHVHTIWRDKNNDFGGDALRAHLEHSEHHQ